VPMKLHPKFLKGHELLGDVCVCVCVCEDSIKMNLKGVVCVRLWAIWLRIGSIGK
jgi:hypothetical protein